VPISILTRAYSRVHDELVKAIVAEPADLIYAGTTGALAAAAESAGRLGVPYGLDLEDFHSGEHVDGEDPVFSALAERIEERILNDAAFLTAGSPMIADAYAVRYGVEPRAVHNTFSRQFAPPLATDSRGPVRLYWFSQTLGCGRGLEDVVRGLGASGVAAELHLRGRAVPEFVDRLQRLRAAEAPALKLVVHEPSAPDDMVSSAHGYDLGLACEEPTSANRRLCLTNKIFTYLAAGLPEALSDTPAQTRLAADLGAAAFVYQAGHPEALAAHLRVWANEPDRRDAARIAARAAADRRWHWEHPEDRGAVLELAASFAGAAN